MAEWLARAKKAVGATVASAVVIWFGAQSDGSISPEEWGAIAASLVVGGITYYLRNKGKGLNANGSEPAPRV